MIYLDYNATTPCAPEVLEAMLPYFSEKFGNPASRTHAKGWQADEAVKQATEHLAQLINCAPAEIVYTSGATESCNLAIKGVYERLKPYGNHIITCSTEHKAVLDTCAHLEQQGATVTYLDVDEQGQVSLEAMSAAITEQTILIALMYANNETGVVHPVVEIGKIARARKIYFFCDATQAVGKIPVDVQSDYIDLLALSAHKFYGPKGVGALYINRRSPRVQLVAQTDGGGHQNGFRSGTLNVPGIVGLGKAAMRCKTEECQNELMQIDEWRDEIEAGLLTLPGTLINGAAAKRLPNVINIAFGGIKAERLVSVLNDEFAFSVGSACTSAQQKASHVLQAMHLDPKVIEGSVRISLGRLLTAAEIPVIINRFKQAVAALQ
ncbi:MAG: IscS subfamily cysteine desulfurase [Bacteroidetes bacterium 43-16]|nr:MAG: IscS subfamily cysteine desulfurase [Bacteroidetes bacterium 43-16]